MSRIYSDFIETEKRLATDAKVLAARFATEYSIGERFVAQHPFVSTLLAIAFGMGVGHVL